MICKVLLVSRSGFYKWVEGPVSNRAVRQKVLLEKIRAIHLANRKRYGRRRIYQAIVKGGEKVGKGTIERLMRKHGIRPWYTKRFRAPRVSNPKGETPPNALNRGFQPGISNQVWLSDLTQIRTLEGWLYISVIEDLGTRRAIGWSMSNRMTSGLVLAGIRMAFSTQGTPKKVMFHSDQGSQYRSEEVVNFLRTKGVEVSMSRRGNCWDNAPMESFFATLKRELYLDVKWPRQKVKSEVFEFIEAYYNRSRYHSSLDYLTPAEYEALKKSEFKSSKDDEVYNELFKGNIVSHSCRPVPQGERALNHLANRTFRM